ncbi:uncharacterized protein T551_03750, partial [Pneumocystis jirovecii RU7]
HSLARAVARAVKRQAQQVVKSVYDDEDYLLALILKEKTDNTKNKACETELKKYCKNLKDVYTDLEKISPKLKDICNHGNPEKKCVGLKDKIKNICETFKSTFQKVNQNPLDTNCKESEQKCLFLEDACSGDLKDGCNTIRNKCYQKKREKVAEKALLRALNGHLKDKDTCKEKLKELCPKLGQESNELAQKCFDTDSTCEPLVKTAEEKCKSLKTEVGKVINSNEELQKRGRSLLKECHFYGQNCDNNESKCSSLQKKCKEKEIFYVPPGSDFNPTKPEPTLAEKIGLEELHKEAATQGILLGKPPERDVLDLLVFLSGSDPFDDTQCEKVLTNKCSSIQHLAKELENLCKDKGKYGDKCKKFKGDFEKTKGTLTTMFQRNSFENNEIILWNELPNFLSENDCIKLQSDCFYFESQTGFEKICKNVKATCYKKGRDALANQVLQDKMRGKHRDTNNTLYETIQKELVKACVGLKGESDELFVLCVQPIEGAVAVLTDLHMKTDVLQGDLNEKRDFPTKQDCEELLKKCNDLRQDSEELEWPCRTLEHHCNRLNIAEQLEERLLEGKVKDLDNFNSCLENLGKQCREWSRKGRTQFALSCVAQNITCKILTKSVESKCTTLKARMKASDVMNKIKKNDEKESTCSTWAPYCTKFMSSCQNLTAGDGKCKKLNKECKLFIERKDLEEKVAYELKGSLKTEQKCQNTLEKYCTQWANASNGLETLCKENGKEDNQVREELCKKLVEQVKKQCSGLQKKLTEASKELEKKASEYEDIKKKAEDAMKKASLVLSKAKVENNKSENEVVPSAPAVPSGKDTKPFRLIRRDATAKVTEDEAKAFDLVAQAFGLYVELREICHDLLKGCGFKKECDCENQCEKIENTCKKLKPLEVKPYEATTKNVTTTTTTTTTTTETVKDAKATECQSLQTTDTWVTKTSTHTSTSTTTSTVTSRITLTSTRRCKPTKCTTGEEDEAGDVKPSEGLRMSGWSVMRGVLLAMMISFMI